MGEPAWARGRRFATRTPARLARGSRLDAELRRLDARLNRARPPCVLAGPVSRQATSRQLTVDDPQLAHRGHFVPLATRSSARCRSSAAASGSRTRRAAPARGTLPRRARRGVLREVLGLDAAEIARLAAQEVLT